MKTKNTIFLSFAILFLAAFGLSGCLFAVAVPEVTQNGSVLSWESSDNISGYEVALTNETEQQSYFTSENSFDIIGFVYEGEWKVKVKAVAQGFFYRDSDYSKELSVSVQNTLQVPTNLVVTRENSSRVSVTWNAVTGATGYSVKVEGQNGGEQPVVVQTTENSATLNVSQIGQGDVYKISVRANASSYNGQNGIFVSSYSDETNYTFEKRLDAPTIQSFSKFGNSYNLRWSSVEGATAYKVSLLGTNQIIQATSTSVDVSTISGGLPTIAGGTTDVQIAFVQAIGNGELSLNSDFSLGSLCLASTSTTNLENYDVEYFYSKFSSISAFDFCANSQQELEAIINFAVTYRLKEITFYQDFNSNDAIKTAFSNYPEIMSLSRTVPTAGKGLKVIGITYETPSTPMNTADKAYKGYSDNKVTQVEFNSISSYSKNPRSADPNYSEQDLPIYSRDKAMNVYTSEQLFMAVQAGYLPVIVSDCGVQEVWDEAVNVATSIIDDTMTDYEKVLAIFDWVCYNNRYDYNLFSYTVRESELIDEFYTNSWTNVAAEREYNEIEDTIRYFRGFYLEGMFLDDGQAVCDGIAKAFSLLCGIENIEAYKVNGMAGGGGHAWNKVALDLNNDSFKEWYTIDCTWNDYSSLKQEDVYRYTELLTHNYFLVTDASIYEHNEEWPNKDVSSTDFDYFNKTVMIEGVEYDFYIDETTTSEINLVVDYLCENYDNFEIKISNDNIQTSFLSRQTIINYVLDRINKKGEGWMWQSVDNDVQFTTYVIYKS